MNSVIRKGVTALVLGASVLAVAAPADAQHYRGRYHYRHHGGSRTGLALGAGVLGLAVGAAIASDNGYRNDRSYDRGYYGGGYDRGGYGGGYYDRGYYDQGYAEPYYRAPHCYMRPSYDPYYGRRVMVRYCD
jgi:hypothetical protein